MLSRVPWRLAQISCYCWQCIQLRWRVVHVEQMLQWCCHFIENLMINFFLNFCSFNFVMLCLTLLAVPFMDEAWWACYKGRLLWIGEACVWRICPSYSRRCSFIDTDTGCCILSADTILEVFYIVLTTCKIYNSECYYYYSLSLFHFRSHCPNLLQKAPQSSRIRRYSFVGPCLPLSLGPNLQNFVKCTYENVTRELQSFVNFS